MFWKQLGQMSAHDKQMVLHQTLQQLQQLGGSADPDNMLAASDEELVEHTNVVTDQSRTDRVKWRTLFSPLRFAPCLV